MAVSNLDDFQALDPFFRIIEEGVAGLVDGEHFFDLLAEDVVFEYIITVPGYPRRVAERQAVAELYRPYGATIVLDRCYDLAVHHDQVTGVVVLEYASQGRVVRPGLPTATATSRCCRSSTARSLTGATTSIRSRSLTRSAGPPRAAMVRNAMKKGLPRSDAPCVLDRRREARCNVVRRFGSQSQASRLSPARC